MAEPGSHETRWATGRASSELMPHRHVTAAARSGGVRLKTKDTYTENQTMRDLLADWRRGPRTDRIVGLVTLAGEMVVASRPYPFASGQIAAGGPSPPLSDGVPRGKPPDRALRHSD